jgi:hypothetical protein
VYCVWTRSSACSSSSSRLVVCSYTWEVAISLGGSNHPDHIIASSTDLATMPIVLCRGRAVIHFIHAIGHAPICVIAKVVLFSIDFHSWLCHPIQ